MTEISYQNKDITAKIFGENLKEKSFKLYGVDLPKVVKVLPTNLPIIEANEMRIDNIFLLEDGSFAILDYESTYQEKDKIKYLGYIIRILKKLKINRKNIKIRMIVLYTADVNEADVKLDVGCLKFQIEPGYLVSIETKKEYGVLKQKIEQKETLTDEEIMKLIILPLTVKGKEGKQNMLEKSIELAKNIEEESKQVFALAGIITFGDKVINKEYANQVKEWIMMTKVARLFEEEKQEAIKQIRKEEQREKQEALKQMRKEEQREKQEALKKLEAEKNEEIKNLKKELNKLKNL